MCHKNSTSRVHSIYKSLPELQDHNYYGTTFFIFIMDNVQRILGTILNTLVHVVNEGRLLVNKSCETFEPWQLIFASVGATLLFAWIWNEIYNSNISKYIHYTSG